jgi:O-antigen/teichoic acid export membrane protein
LRDRLQRLSKGVAIYGAGDAAISIVSLLLLPVYIKYGYLGAADYGALAVIVALETFLKVVFRWGLDGAFMRFYYQREDGAPKQRLASTIALFMLAANGVLLAGALAASPAVAARLFDDARYLTALRLMLVNTFLISFTFLPFHLMRMREEAAAYSAFAFARSAGTLVLRIGLVIGLGLGVTGLYLADLAVTIVLLPLLWPWARRVLAVAFSTAELRAALRFGLPRLPHGLAVQALDGGNKLLFGRYVTDFQLGVYNIAVTLGQGIKFFLSAFETAWAPFYYATAEQPDARQVFGKMTTYSIAVLTLLVAGTTAIARDAILVMSTPDFLGGARVMPLIALGMAFQGVYLLTSIGLNLTGRTEFYPVSTISAAIVGLSSGAWLMPRYGAVGAAAAFLLSYVTQAAVAFVFARRVYRIPYEGLRLARIASAGVIAAAAGLWLVPPLAPLAGLLLRGSLTVMVYVGLLWISGFLRPTERAFLREILGRLRERRTSRPLTSDAG